MKIVRDDFNSNVFGLEMANIICEETNQTMSDLTVLLKNNSVNMYEHLTFKIPTNDKKTLNSALQLGFYLCDTLVEYAFYFEKSSLPKMKHKVILRDCLIDDLPYIKEIAKHSFKIDRFHSDEHLDDELCDEYYERWIENSFNGFAEKIIIAEVEGIAVGFTTGKTYKDDPWGRLVLSAVSDKYRGLGIYTSIIHESVKWMKETHPELKGIIVGTQIDNIAVQKAWCHLGFIAYDSKYVLQKYNNSDI